MRQLLIISMLLVILSIFSFSAFAGDLALKPGQFLSVDAAELKNPQGFYFVASSDSNSNLSFKTENENDFECEIISQKIIRRFETVSRPAEVTYLFYVMWSPGADYSGCTIQIAHEDFKNEKAILKIRMAY